MSRTSEVLHVGFVQYMVRVGSYHADAIRSESRFESTTNHSIGNLKMKNKLFAVATLFILLFTQAAQAQEIEKLAWMAGTWAQKQEGALVQESWVGPSGNVMVAVNLSTSAKRGTSYEFLRIAASGTGLSYFASPGGKTPVEFKLKEMGDKRVVFENLTHDFPYRIIYALEADGALKARIEGTIQNKARSMEWRFEAVK